MSATKKILQSSIWLYLGQWFNRLIGLVSTLILAKILTPDDFGIVASALIVTTLFTVITTDGANYYLLRLEKITNQELNTAWTIGILLRLIASICIFSSASFAANILNDDRLTLILQVFSISPIISAFTNIGLVTLEKKMDYLPQFKLTTIAQLLAFTVKVALAVVYHSYWAFIAAEIALLLTIAIGSYFISSYRPKFSLYNWKKQWAFSQWVLAKGFFAMLRYKLDNLFIAKFFSASSVGLYSVTRDIATIPAGQVITPILRPLYVSLADSLNNPLLFAEKVQKAIFATALITLPIGFGISATGQWLVDILLGAKWSGAVEVINILAFITIPGTMIALFSQILTVLGKVKASLLLDIALGFLTIGIFIWLGSQSELAEFAELRVAIGVISFFITLFYLSSISKISFAQTMFSISIPLFSSLIMYLALGAFSAYFMIESAILMLVMLIVIGVVLYSFCTLTLLYLLKEKSNQVSFIWLNSITIIKLIKTKIKHN